MTLGPGGLTFTTLLPTLLPTRVLGASDNIDSFHLLVEQKLQKLQKRFYEK